MKSAIPFFLAALLISISLSACGPSPVQLDATSTQIAANIFATQTAKAPTATMTFTPSLTPTATPTNTPTPTPTNTATPTPTPTPGLSTLALNQSDLPAGYVALPAEQLNKIETNLPAGASAFGFTNDKTNQIVIGIFFPFATRTLQSGFDASLPQLLQIEAASLGATGASRKLSGLDKIGELCAGISATSKFGSVTMRWDIGGLRRDRVGMILVIGYVNGDKPNLTMVDFATKLDERTTQYLTDNP